MKKTICLFFTIIFSLCLLTVCAEGYEKVDVYVNGALLETDQPAIIVNGRTLVPLRAITEALNCQVTWNEAESSIKIENDIVIIKLQINNYAMNVLERENQANVKSITLDMHPVIYNSRTLVPARAISEAIHARVDWNDSKRCVEIVMEYDAIDMDNFSDGMAAAKKNGKWGYINEKREEVLPFVYDGAKSFFKGYARVQKDALWGIIDTKGNIVVPIEYNRVQNVFKSELLAVKKSGKWGFVNKEGTLVIPAIYEDIETAEDGFTPEGYAAVKKDGKWGYIDTSGNTVIPFEYDQAKGLRKGYAAVKKGDKWGFVSKDGKLMLDYIYDDAYSFIIDQAMVVIEGKSYIIDLEGNIIN